MKYLLLDISPKKIVWASNVDGRSTGTKTLYIKCSEDPTVRFTRCEQWLIEMIEEMGSIDQLFVVTLNHQDGKRTACHEGLAKTIERVAAVRIISVRRFSKANLTKRAWEYGTGEKRRDKKQIIRAARVCGWSLNDHREAVAAFMLELFMYVALDGP